MSVYTKISKQELEQFLSNYNMQALVSYHGIQAGTVNSNYFVNTSDKQFVLTIFETLANSQINFYLQLTDFLSQHKIPCPNPIYDITNQVINSLQNKPAVLFPKLSGQTLEQVTTDHCQQIAQTIAKMHLLTNNYKTVQKNYFGNDWLKKTIDIILPKLNSSQCKLLTNAVNIQTSFDFKLCPKGIIHADIFRDNVLFTNNKLTGIIDFYFACTDIYLLDLAILINDWCFDNDQQFDQEKSEAIITSYEKIRPLSESEHAMWKQALFVSTLRFWVSRLDSALNCQASDNILIKDPGVYEQRLRMNPLCLTP